MNYQTEEEIRHKIASILTQIAFLLRDFTTQSQIALIEVDNIIRCAKEIQVKLV